MTPPAWTDPVRLPERIVQQGIALLLAQRGGRSVPIGDLLRWADEGGLSADQTLHALDRLVHERAIFRDADGWRPRSPGLQSRSIDAMAERARFRV